MLTVEKINEIYGKADDQKTWSNVAYSTVSNILHSILEFWSLGENKKLELMKFLPMTYSGVGLFIYT